MSEPLNADFTTLEQLRSQLLDLAAALDNSHRPLGDAYDGIREGAGQVADALADGAAQFLLAWKVAFDEMSDGVSVVASSIGRSVVDLSATDAVSSSTIVL